jgi:hypothetical protein
MSRHLLFDWVIAEQTRRFEAAMSASRRRLARMEYREIVAAECSSLARERGAAILPDERSGGRVSVHETAATTLPFEEFKRAVLAAARC